MLIRRLPSLPTWTTSFRELDEARRDFDRLFESLSGLAGLSAAGVFPAMNVSEDDHSVRVRAELPGIDPKDLEITVENDTLTVAGKRETAVDGDDVSYHRREREWGSFRRSFSIPTRVESGKTEARYVDGILTVTLPKAAEARPKQITVRTGA